MSNAAEQKEIQTVSIKPSEKLYAQYDGQTGPQPCYLYLDPEERKLWCDYEADIGPGTPIPVYHGRLLRWRIPALRQWAADELMTDVADSAVTVCSAYTCEFDGSNLVGEVSDSASDALAEIARACAEIDDNPFALYRYWEARDWLSGVSNEQLDITADMTDGAIDALTAKLVDDAEADEEVDEVEGLREEIERRVAELQD